MDDDSLVPLQVAGSAVFITGGGAGVIYSVAEADAAALFPSGLALVFGVWLARRVVGSIRG